MNSLNFVTKPNPLTITDISNNTKLLLSLKKANTHYTGATINARRDSDNATEDFYADTNGNLTDLSSNTLLQWGYGSSEIYVAKWYDQSGLGNDATQSTAILQPMIEPTNQLSMQFDGSSQYARIADLTTYNDISGITIECWMKTSAHSYTAFVAKRGAYGFYMNSGGKFLGGSGQGKVFDSGVYVNDGKWHHLGMTYIDTVSGGVVLYVDGAYRGSFTNTADGASICPFVIGGEVANNVPQKLLNGYVDEVRLWNRVLTATEISQYYNRRISPDTPNLVAYYSLDEASGNTLYEKVSGTHNMTLYGNAAVWSSSVPAPYSNKFYLNFSTLQYMTLPNGTIPYNENPYTIIAHHGRIVENSTQNTLISGGGMSLICDSSYSHYFSSGTAATGGVYTGNAIISAKYDNTNFYLYVNGNLTATSPDKPAGLTNTYNAIGTLGSDPTNTTFLYNGDIYSVAIYSKALNDYTRRALEKQAY